MIYAGTSQSVYYGIDGTPPNRLAIFEFYESHISQSSYYYHFQIVFDEAAPGVVKFIYFEATDGGASATVGVQRESSFCKISTHCSALRCFLAYSRVGNRSGDDLLCQSSECTDRQYDTDIRYQRRHLYGLDKTPVTIGIFHCKLRERFRYCFFYLI